MTKPGPLASHPSEEDLELYALGRLAEEAIPAVEEHLLLCESCQNKTTEFEELGRAYREYRAAPPRAAARPPARRPVYWAAGLAAAALLLVAIALAPSGAAPAAMVELTSWRGEAEPDPAPAGRRLDLVLSANGLPDGVVQVAVAASGGEIVWQGPGRREGNRVRARVEEPLRAGQYWVRILDGDRLLREFPLRVGG